MEGRRLTQVLSNLPYEDASIFLKTSCQMTRPGFALKLRLNILEPLPSQAKWRKVPPSSRIIALGRATLVIYVVKIFVRQESLSRNGMSLFSFFPPPRCVYTAVATAIHVYVVVLRAFVRRLAYYVGWFP